MVTAPVNRNVELKARIRTDFSAIHAALQYLGAEFGGTLAQQDIYFHCAEVKDLDPSRLKLRGESTDGENWQWWMIWYRRPDRRAPRPSDYRIAPIGIPDSDSLLALVETLDAAWQRYAVVNKHRQLFWFRDREHLGITVRIHLDEVVNLDRFVEFEAIVTSEEEQAEAHKSLERLKNLFQIDSSDLVEVSYGDLMRSQVERIRR
jgi:adenylate cyclase class IV